MTINFADKTLNGYLTQLSSRESVPGGGSAAALTAAIGAALVAMAANYSLGRKGNTKAVEKRITKIAAEATTISQRLLVLTSLDSEAYLKVSAARKLDAKAQKAAAKPAREVPQEVCKLCYKALNLLPFLVERGNPWLLSDVEVAAELLMASFNGAQVMVRINS